MKILLPKTLLEETEEFLSLPLFFLAGPILGGGDWHARMSEILTQKAGDCIIVNPSRYSEDHSLINTAAAVREIVSRTRPCGNVTISNKLG